MKATRLSLLCCLAGALAPASTWADPGDLVAPGAPGDPIVGAAYAPQRTLTGGVLLGLGITDLGGDVDATIYGMPASPPLEVTEGPGAGGYLAFQLDERWGGRVELRYAQRGAIAAGAVAGPSGSLPIPIDLRLAYLQVPVMATFTIPYDGRLVPFFFAGPDLAWLLSAEVEGEIPMLDADGNPLADEQGNFQSYDIAQDVSEGVARFDVGVTLGAGMKLPLALGRLALDIRYTLGITEAADGVETVLATEADEDIATLTPHHLRHRVLLLTAAYEL